MPIIRDGQPVTALYRGDRPVARRYRGDRLVWQAIITVTPEAPTFHDGDPWVTLPTVEGVTYTVAGTPDWGASITITASAEDGYQLDGQVEWEHQYETLPLVTIGNASNTEFRQACIDHGTTYDTVVELPFRLDTSQAPHISNMFRDCSSLVSVPDMDTSQVTNMQNAFRGCTSLTQVPDLQTSQVSNMNNTFRDTPALTDGNVRLIGRHPTVFTPNMITGSGLTREPFYDTNGNPI